ncbi:MAG: flagellar protein FlgN [candidate division KSB1 bacterium]|nr:flagellar protein FlgN [candidate division KSB1 bacterium]
MVSEVTTREHVREPQYELEKALHDLVEVIEREVALFQDLLEALNRQHQAVLQEETEPVLHSNARVQELVEETRRVEQSRAQTTAAVSTHLGMETRQPTLSQIIPLVEEHYAQRLRELREILLSLTQRVQETNLRNKRLLNRALHTVTTSIRLLSGQNGVYDDKGREQPANRQCFTVQT